MPQERRTLPVRFLPARYIGTHRVYLRSNGQWDYTTPTGEALPTRTFTAPLPSGGVASLTVGLLEPGGIILMPDTELLGQTFLVDTIGGWPDLWLGAGWRPLEQHVGLQRADLLGVRFKGPYDRYWSYRFDEGRSDFEPVEEPADSPEAPEASVDPAEPAVVGDTPVQTSQARQVRTALNRLAADALEQVAAGEELPSAEFIPGRDLPPIEQPEYAPAPDVLESVMQQRKRVPVAPEVAAAVQHQQEEAAAATDETSSETPAAEPSVDAAESE